MSADRHHGDASPSGYSSGVSMSRLLFTALLIALATTVGDSLARNVTAADESKAGTADKKDAAPGLQTKDELYFQRAQQKLQRQVARTFRRGKGDFFVIALSETTHHTAVERTVVRKALVDGVVTDQRSTENRNQPGRYFPVPRFDVVLRQGQEEAVDLVVCHMSRYIKRPEKRGRSRTAKRKRNSESPPAFGGWKWLGRFASRAEADQALEQAAQELAMNTFWRQSGEVPPRRALSACEPASVATFGPAAEENQPVAMIVVSKPTGGETVSFKRDIAPFMVNLCLRCHNNRQLRSGFSLETFEKLLEGGDSGIVITPGKLDESRLWDLVGKQDPIKMPAGQARVTRANWENLKTWIVEGAKFDGEDAQASLQSLVPTDAEKKMQRLAQLSPEEFLNLRKTRSLQAWKRVLPKETPEQVESRELFVIGNVSPARLERVKNWGEEQIESLKSRFEDPATPMFPGRLSLFVMKDRYSYEEFNHEISRRDTPPGIFGHVLVRPDFEDAYVVLQDTGDKPSADVPTTQFQLIALSTEAVLRKASGKLPEWLVQGTGLASAADKLPDTTYLDGMRNRLPEILQKVQKPGDVYVPETFQPSEIGPVGYTLISYIRKRYGNRKFESFSTAVMQSGNPDTAIQLTFRIDAYRLARRYLRSFSGKDRREKP